MDELVVKVASRMAEQGVSLVTAANEIGVTTNTLGKHLNGEYVRSDSAAKYRRWLAGGRRHQAQRPGPMPANPRSEHSDELWEQMKSASQPAPTGPHRVVDLFSGCGGLSLGFELLGGGHAFDTVLAVDIEEAMLTVLDENRKSHGQTTVGRRVDLSDLTCEAEALAFYVDHLVRTGQAPEETERGLDNLPHGRLKEFQRSVARLDASMREAWERCRQQPQFRAALKEASPDSLKQTSVLSFHTSLRLPTPGSPDFAPPVLWWSPEVDEMRGGDHIAAPRRAVAAARRLLEAEWDEALGSLRRKASGVGTGQLASSARRITAFLSLVDSGAYSQLKDAWLDWRSRRDALRTHFFNDALPVLRAAYQPVAADVVLGGPPCQGFSRIGRGKIRSLRESGVQAHTDDEAGDERNRLLFAYVLMVSALQPKMFLFENVRHFQAEVRTETGVFRAEEVLAEAIEDLSAGGVTYGAESRVLRASDHGVPQTRERFFMAGVRSDDGSREDAAALAAMVLNLPSRAEVPLLAALEGLPTPSVGRDSLVRVAAPAGEPLDGDPRSEYVAWLRQPFRGHIPSEVDAHVARTPRRDDADWFDLMGPGKRWMDYRVENSPSLTQARSLVERIARAVGDDPRLARKLGVDLDEAESLLATMDGSFALRLLLESIEPHDGELAHHLLTPNYLSKKEGRHGDWLARLAADRPCKTITSHMGKDTYGYVHPFQARTLSVREAARVQSFPDWYSFGMVSLVDGFRVVGNAVPPLLSAKLGERVLAVVNGAASSA